MSTQSALGSYGEHAGCSIEWGSIVRDADLVIVGGGPAGCAAARMASSLGMTSILIEPNALCEKVARIGHTENVIGYESGAEFAAQAAKDVAASHGCSVLRDTAAEVRAGESSVEVATASSGTIRAPFAVLATGVRPRRIDEAPWIVGTTDFPELISTEPEQLRGVESIVLGVDRPLGTVLRTHPDLDMRLLAMYPVSEAYKANEVADDPRVTLMRVRRVEVMQAHTGSRHLDVESDDGTRTFTADRVYLNLGVEAAVPPGDLVTDDTGYCPPDRQHRRVLIAGDLRSSRYQRIMTALGSGAESALHAYYQLSLR